MADINPLFGDLGIEQNPQAVKAGADNSLMSDLGIEPNDAVSTQPDSKEPEGFWSAAKGEIDAGLSLASGAIAGTAGSVARTANRLVPDWGGTKEELKNKIDAAQDSMTWAPKTPEGQWTLDQFGKVVKPVSDALAAGTGAVVGKENVPAVADAVGAIPGLDIAASAPSAIARGLVRGGGGAEMAGTAAAADAAGIKTSVGQASGNPIIKAYENVASKLPGGGPLKEARDVNGQIEHSVSDIIKQINPNYDFNPATASEAGEEISKGAKGAIQKGKEEVGEAAKSMNEAVGGKDTPMGAPKTHAALESIISATGIPEVDDAILGARTRSAAKVIQKVEKEPTAPKSYTTDGEGAHTVKSENGETHAVEQANGDLKVTRSDTAESARGNGEGTGRLETLAHAATSKGAALVSDISISPGEAAAYEKLGRRGWKVEKNPNAEVNPETGNIVSDSPKNPVYKITAPKTEGASRAFQSGTSEKQFSGEWTYDPKTGKSEPVTKSKNNIVDLGEFADKKFEDDYHHETAGMHLNSAQEALNRYYASGQHPSFHDSLIETAVNKMKEAKTPFERSEAANVIKFRAENAAKDAEQWNSKGPPKAQLDEKTPWTFESFRALRTSVGRAIKASRDLGQRSQLQRLYGVMSDDLKDFVKTKGPDAEHKFELFNEVAKTRGDQRAALEKAIKNVGGPGEIFNKTMRGSSEDAGKIAQVMGAMDENGKNTFRSVVLHRMGRVAGAQTGPYSADTFLKNWDKMSPEAKNVLFGGTKSTGKFGSGTQVGQLRKSLDALTSALTDFKAGGQLKSGLGKELGAVGASMGHGVGLLGSLYALKEFGHPLVQMAESHPIAALAGGTGLAGMAAINPVMSRVLTNPKVVQWLAQSTKMPKSGLPAMMVQLHQMGQKDKDAKDLESLIGSLGNKNDPQKPEGTGIDDKPIRNNHKMVPLATSTGRPVMGVDPNTF